MKWAGGADTHIHLTSVGDSLILLLHWAATTWRDKCLRHKHCIYLAWMLKLKAHRMQFVPNTVFKSDPLLTKLIMCLGKEGAWLSRHPEYTCTHTGNATAINTELHPLPKGSDSTCRYSYTCSAWILSLPKPYMLLLGVGRERQMELRMDISYIWCN